MFFHYEAVISAFQLVGVDAYFDEDTPDTECQKKVDQWNNLRDSDRAKVPRALLESNPTEVQHFMASLTVTMARQIEKIIIMPLHGKTLEMTSIGDALEFIAAYDENMAPSEFVRYEIQIRFNNGNEITGKFKDKAGAAEFLRIYQPTILG